MANIIQNDRFTIPGIGDSEIEDNNKYFVYLIFPYPIIHENNLKYMDYSSDTHIPFSRRLVAERYRILRMVSYYEQLGNTERVIYFREREKKLEEEHPEWLI